MYFYSMFTRPDANCLNVGIRAAASEVGSIAEQIFHSHAICSVSPPIPELVTDAGT